MKRREMLVVVFSFAGGIWFLFLAVRFFQRGDTIMGLLIGAAGIGMLLVAREDLTKLHRL